MKNKNTLMRGWFAVVMLAMFCTAGAVVTKAQSREQYVISAKAGGVNFASGDVTVRRRGASRQESLAPQDALNNGDAIITGASGRVEVLLLPGSYLRVGENSEFEFVDTALDSLRVKLVRGSAVIEAAGTDDARSLVEVSAPQTTVTVDKRGLYRVNALPNGTTEVFVRKGRALVTNASAGTIKVEGGKWITVGGGQATVAKFDKKLDRDAFDSWSGQRAETLAAANKRLSNRALGDTYSSYRSGFRNGRLGIGFYPGLWVYDPLFGGHTFLPFYYGLSSPYGHGYSHGFGLSPYSIGIYPPFGGHSHGGFRIVIGGIGRNSSHRSDHFSSQPHTGAVHHQSHHRGHR